MNELRQFIDKLKNDLEARRIQIAVVNGTSRDRALDQYRFAAGQCSGLSEAAAIIDETMKRLIEEDDL